MKNNIQNKLDNIVNHVREKVENELSLLSHMHDIDDIIDEIQDKAVEDMKNLLETSMTIEYLENFNGSPEEYFGEEFALMKMKALRNMVENENNINDELHRMMREDIDDRLKVLRRKEHE